MKRTVNVTGRELLFSALLMVGIGVLVGLAEIALVVILTSPR